MNEYPVKHFPSPFHAFLITHSLVQRQTRQEMCRLDDHVSFKLLVANPLSQKVSSSNVISVVYSLDKLIFLLLGQLAKKFLDLITHLTHEKAKYTRHAQCTKWQITNCVSCQPKVKFLTKFHSQGYN